MQGMTSYKYAVIRIVPRVDRDEFINAGVILYQAERGYLKAKTLIRDAQLKALSSEIDTNTISRHLKAFELICEGDSSAGPIARLSKSERFQWLTSPRSTIIQTSPVKAGVGAAPDTELKELTNRLVA